MKAAVAAIRQQQPARVIVAVPAAPPEICDELRQEADEVVCALTPQGFSSVGGCYEDFPQTTDEEVQAILSVC